MDKVTKKFSAIFTCLLLLMMGTNGFANSADESNTQDCAVNVERQIEGFYRMHDRIDKNLDAGDMVQVVFERDYMRLGYLKTDVESALENCKKENPRADFTAVQSKVDKVVGDYVSVENKFNGIEDTASKSTKTRYDLHEYNTYLNQYPTSRVNGIDYSKDFVFTKADGQEFLNATDDGSVKYTQDYGPGQTTIAAIHNRIKDETYIKKLYRTVDELMGSINYEKTKSSLDAMIKDFTHFQEVFFPGDENLTKIIAYAKQKRSEVKG